MPRICEVCGICPLAAIPYEEQLLLKEERVRRLFPGVIVARVHPSRPWGYRATVKLRVADNPLRLGIYAPGTHEVVDLTSCPLHHREINIFLQGLKKLLLHYGIPVAKAGGGFLRGVAVRFFGERVGAVLVTRSGKKHHNRNWQRFLGAVNAKLRPLFLVQNYHDREDNVFFGTREVIHFGRERQRVFFGGREFQVPVGAFMQANPETAQAAYEKILAHLPREPATVAELYSGAALTGLTAAWQGHRVMAVEVSPASVEAARITAGRWPELAFTIHEGDVDAHLAELRDFAPRVVLVNPPRKGLSERVVETIKILKPELLVYMSCNPATLARDAGSLAAVLSLRELTPFDMFPQTEHLEVVARFEKRSRE